MKNMRCYLFLFLSLYFLKGTSQVCYDIFFTFHGDDSINSVKSSSKFANSIAISLLANRITFPNKHANNKWINSDVYCDAFLYKEKKYWNTYKLNYCMEKFDLSIKRDSLLIVENRGYHEFFAIGDGLEQSEIELYKFIIKILPTKTLKQYKRNPARLNEEFEVLKHTDLYRYALMNSNMRGYFIAKPIISRINYFRYYSIFAIRDKIKDSFKKLVK